MTLEPGTRFGSYEIVAAIGAGGMGEVYRARDTSLNRDVAIKVLSGRLADDPDRLARFQREAEALAALNHPNVAAIYGVVPPSGNEEVRPPRQALVMELVEGEDLSERIARGAIPLDEALPIARQIADALDAAHEAGIVHRDLKPANIKVKEDGTVKVLDFGLAKALGPDSAISSADDLSNSPTLTARATQAGMILGTAAYMSPEQARGRTVDKRADIWAFGAVLYEMVMGARLFAGEDLTETLASVVKDRPDFSDAPREVRRLLETCLQKNPKDRLRDIGDAWALLDSASVRGAEAAEAMSPAKLPWVIAAVAAIAAIVMAGIHFGEATAPLETSRFQVPLPRGTDALAGSFVALSPDGRYLAMLIEDQVWVRSFDSLETTPVEGTVGATYPFWSPDGSSIGFFADGQLKTVVRTGGLVRTVTTAGDGRGATWSSNGTIVFSPGLGEEGLVAVDAQGGDVRSVTTLSSAGGADAHRYPQFLPDGERFLYLHLTSVADVEGTYVGSLDGTLPVRILEGGDQTGYAPSTANGEPGHLLFRRGEVLMAQPFDEGSLQAVGAAFPVADQVGESLNTGSAAFSSSATGELAYAPSRFANTQAYWVDREGLRLGPVTDLAGVDTFAISLDQQYAAVGILEDEVTVDVWLQDLSGGSPSKFTYGPAPGWSLPVWAPDRSWVAYTTYDLAGLAQYEVRRKPTDMSGAEQALWAADTAIYTWGWAPDGSYLVLERLGDLLFLRFDGDGEPTPFLETPERESYGQVSPDGRWLAYAVGPPGAQDVFVKSIPATGSLWQISTDGGSMPRWRQDGRELFYRAADGTLTAVTVGANLAREGAAAASFEYDPTPRPLFGRVPTFGNISRLTYQPSVDGQRFAMTAPATGADAPITVVLNWQASVGR